MKLIEKRQFIRTFMRSMTEAALAKAKDMPVDWDGIELRHYLAEKLAYESFWPMDGTKRMVSSKGEAQSRRKRMRNYRNVIATTNL